MYKKEGYAIDSFDYYCFFEGGQSELDLDKYDVLIESEKYKKEKKYWYRKLKLKKIYENVKK